MILRSKKLSKKINGTITVWSNSPGQTTGYGQQAEYLVNRLKRDGAKVAASSNYGLEGSIAKHKTPYGEIPHYPRGLDPYSNDVAPYHHQHWKGQNPDLPDALITLYDVWVLKGKGWDSINIASWVPIDHASITQGVEAWLRKENVTPIAMAPNGQRLMEAKGIECEYVPHGIDTKIFKPSNKIQGMDVREYMGLTDQFIVGMNAANKSSGLMHRKCFSENLLAFAIFRTRHPDAVLYLHTEPIGATGGWNLIAMLQAFGIPSDAVMFPPMLDYKYGIAQPDVAALYSAMDVLLAPALGEGFGLATIEAQACGTRVIGSNWGATPDLVAEDSWLVEGQPTWDPGQNAIWTIPLVPSIVEALERAYEAERGPSKIAIDFAKQFDVDTVWSKYWLPTLDRLLAKSK
jgi:glycosyltransferase involved in cell wall biosynthesis